MNAETPSSLVERLEAVGRNTPEKMGHLALLPRGEGDEYNNVVVRYFPSKHQRKAFPQDPTSAEGQRLIEAAQEHFEILRDFGIQVPTVSFGHEHPDAPRSRIVSIAADAEGVDIAGSDRWSADALILGPDQDKVLKLATSLLQYYGWILDAKPIPRLYLSDLSYLDQYKVTPTGEVILADTDPLMIDPFSESGLYRIQDNLNEVLSWLERMQVRSTTEAKQIQELWTIINQWTKQCRQYIRFF